MSNKESGVFTKQSKTKNDNTKEVENNRFEFILYINNNIICQRDFNIFDFKEDFLNSMDLKDMMDEITGMNNGEFGTLGIIPNHLKKKSIEMLWEKYNPHYVQSEQTKPNTNKKDVFQFEFIVDKKVVAKSEFTNEFYNINPYVSIDIRNVIYDVISEIRYMSSRKKYNLVS